MDCRSTLFIAACLGAALLLPSAATAQDVRTQLDRPELPAPVAATTTVAAAVPTGSGNSLSHEQLEAQSGTATAAGSNDTNATRPPLTYEPNWPEPPSLGSVLTRLLFGTVFTIGLCGGTLWFGRKWLQKTNVLPGTSSNRAMTLVESTRLGGQCVVHLLQIGDQRVLVGTDRTGLQSIVPMPEVFSGVLDEQLATDDVDEFENSVDTSNSLRTFPSGTVGSRPRIIRSGHGDAATSTSTELV